jgi:hypothetical protein
MMACRKWSHHGPATSLGQAYLDLVRTLQKRAQIRSFLSAKCLFGMVLRGLWNKAMVCSRERGRWPFPGWPLLLYTEL